MKHGIGHWQDLDSRSSLSLYVDSINFHTLEILGVQIYTVSQCIYHVYLMVQGRQRVPKGPSGAKGT